MTFSSLERIGLYIMLATTTLCFVRNSSVSAFSSVKVASRHTLASRHLATMFQKAGRASRMRRTLNKSNSPFTLIYSPSSLTELKAQIENEVDPGQVAGTDLRIVRYPHPALRAPNEPVTEAELKDGTIAKLAKEMLLIMYAAEGVGLAAPQVGVNKRLMVYNPTGDAKKWLDEVVLVNPQIVERSDAMDVETEGCLSFPGMNGPVERSKWIKVQAQTLKGRLMKKKFNGWEARIFQHEYDHLDGVVYIDKLTEEGKEGVKERLNELISEFGQGGAL